MKIVKISKISRFANEKTIDLEVSHPDHNFFCNGIAVGNSHSICYSALGAITIWLKFNHPKEFFLALLQSSKFEPKPHEEIRIISGELKHFGINLVPPDLARSEMDFSIDGDNIRYGLLSIKGISEKSLESLKNFRQNTFPSKYDIFMSAKSAGLNIGALSSLIQAGTLTGYKQKRPRLVLEAQVFNLLTDREKRNMITLGPRYDYDLLVCIKDCVEKKSFGDDGKVLISDKRFNTIRSKMELYKKIHQQNSQYEKFANWYFENKLLGYSCSSRLKEILEDGYMDSDDLQEMRGGQKGKFCGIVSLVRKGKSQAGNQYLMLSLHDESTTFKALMCDNQRSKKFSEYVEANKPIPEADDIVTILASVSDDKTLFIEDMSIMTEKIYMKLSDIPDDPEPATPSS
jgi:DNA polymerase III alpha subunit